ncbi:fungal specific transcription factor [Sarocladium implicatum]|nr:fungal specific transcription factor [Sarocladium implicatum]
MSALNPHEILSTLNKAVDESLALGNERLANSKSYLMDDVTIPPETARMWVNNFFHTNGPHFYPAIKDEPLIDAKLLHLLPDLMQMEHVHVDACFLVVYYCVLWQGQFVLDEVTGRLKEEDPRLRRNIYIGGLRVVSTWQRQASGSVTDFVAATFMAQVAAENFDFQLCWEMHRHACMWSEAMHLHLDTSIETDEEASSQSLIATTDGGRMSMWNLVRTELFFRLISGKAPSFSFDLSEWRVNLPFLFFDEGDLQEAVPTTAFLAGSRVTLILIRFFQVIQEPDSHQEDRVSLVLSLCEQVEETVLDWDIFGWQQSFKRETIDGWFLSELALGCCSSILFMLRMISGQSRDQLDISATSEQMSLCKETELRASRRIVLIVCHMTQVIRLPGPQSLSLALGMYCVQVAYATVAAHVLDQPKATTVRDDLLQLERFGRCVNGVASTASEFMPFARALLSVHARLEAWVAQST